MTRLFTGTGDSGQTDLLGDRVAKSDPRIEALGELDEATSAIGLARSLITRSAIGSVLIDVQRDLYRIMAEVAFTDEIRPAHYTFSADRIEWLEERISEIGESVELAPEFVLPGETAPGGAADLARAVVRRAERRAVALSEASLLTNQSILRYLNRLSSLLFIVARAVEQDEGTRAPRAKT
ncbi:MAG: cob(I)yrinic acid a,c-diamide adenosyltransferase [Thermomicrobiales bacterium]